MATTILSLIPEVLHEDLIKEVQEELERREKVKKLADTKTQAVDQKLLDNIIGNLRF